MASYNDAYNLNPVIGSSVGKNYNCNSSNSCHLNHAIQTFSPASVGYSSRSAPPLIPGGPGSLTKSLNVKEQEQSDHVYDYYIVD